jgi:hypothetical protein
MNQRDLELLSSYLDGQLKPSDVERARLESRLSSDPNLRAVLDDLRAARGLLRQLPMRKAPRDFRLTPKMVGKNPPLPRAYPAFRFVTALATLLLFFTVGVNVLAPQMASQAPAFGMGGGGAPEVFSAEEAPAATEAPALEAPAAEPPAQLVPQPTLTLSAEDNARLAETPSQKDGVTGESDGQDQSQIQNAQSPQPVPSVWQIVLAGVALLSAFIMVMMRQLAVNRWRRK